MKQLPVTEIRERLAQTSKGERAFVISRYCETYGVSRDTIYRALRLNFGKSKTVTRKKKVSDTVIHEAAKLKREAELLHLSEREPSSELIIDLMRQRGVEGADTLKVATLNRRLREKGYREAAPYVRVEPKYSNEMHQLDFSRSKYFQLVGFDAVKNDYLVKVSGKELHYKQEDNSRLRTWVVSLLDAYSRVVFYRAYAARGEDISLGLEHLRTAYSGEIAGLPKIYLPEVLKTDNGAFIKNNSVKAMLKALDIRSELSEPYKHRGIQKAESSFRNYWQRFELMTALKLKAGTIITLGEYNDMAVEFCAENIRRKHPVRFETREHIYRAGLSFREQRTIAQDLRDIAFKVIERTVSEALTVSIDNVLYECPRYAMGKKIKVYGNLNGEFAGELAQDGDFKSFILKRTDGYVSTGNFEHRAGNTYKQDIDQELKSDKVKYMKTREKQVRVATPHTRAEGKEFSSIQEARLYVADRLRPYLYSDFEETFEELFTETLQVEGIDAVIEFLKTKVVAN